VTREIVQSLNVLAGQTTVKYGPLQAAAIYAGIAAPYPEVVESLNRKAGNKLPNYREMAGVANQLAGTTSLEVQDALDRLATASLVPSGPSVDTVSGGHSTNGTVSVGGTHTVASGASLVVIVVCGTAQGTFSWGSVSFGGQSCTRVNQSSVVTWVDGSSNTLYDRVEIWKLANPPSGSQSYTANNATNASSGQMIGAVTFFNATTVTDRGTVSGSASSTPAITTNANSTLNNFVIAGLAQGTDTSAPTTDGTTIYNSGNNASGFGSDKFCQIAAYKAAANGATTTVNFTCTNSYVYAGGIVEVGP